MIALSLGTRAQPPIALNGSKISASVDGIGSGVIRSTACPRPTMASTQRWVWTSDPGARKAILSRECMKDLPGPFGRGVSPPVQRRPDGAPRRR